VNAFFKAHTLLILKSTSPRINLKSKKEEKRKKDEDSRRSLNNGEKRDASNTQTKQLTK